MADKNFQITQRNSTNTTWDNLFPMTKGENVLTDSGTMLETWVNSLNLADTTSRLELLDLKQKLTKANLVNFINKTGVGYYDLFKDNSGIDVGSTTAIIDTLNNKVDFVGSKTLKMLPQTFPKFKNIQLGLYPKRVNNVTVNGSINNSITVPTSDCDRILTVGDKISVNGVENQITGLSGTFSLIDRSTPVNVSLTNGLNVRPMMLSNGWIIAVSCNRTYASPTMYFYVSKDNGGTWSQLCFATATVGGSIEYADAISFGNKIYFIYNTATGKEVRFGKFDATTQTNVDINSTTKAIDSNQNAFIGLSIGISSTGGTIGVAICSKNSTYSYNYNLRFTQSTDDGTTWKTRTGTVGVDQVTNYDFSSQDGYFSSPVVVYGKNDVLSIIASSRYMYFRDTVYTLGTINTSSLVRFGLSGDNTTNNNNVGSGWKYYNIATWLEYDNGWLTSTLQKYGTNSGRIWVTWQGKGDGGAVYNIKVSYSDDNGLTWSPVQNLSNGTAGGNTSASICSDKFGNIYIAWSGRTTNSGSEYNKGKIINWNGTSWSNITDFAVHASDDVSFINLMNNYHKFESPIMMWQHGYNSFKFSGKFYAGTNYTLTLQNPVTATNGLKLPISEFTPKQDSTNYKLIGADDDKLIYKFNNATDLSTVNLTIDGKDCSLNNLTYAVS